jgi:hypothetical protein
MYLGPFNAACKATSSARISKQMCRRVSGLEIHKYSTIINQYHAKDSR